MKPRNTFVADMLDMDAPEASGDRLWTASRAETVETADGTVRVGVPFLARKPDSYWVDDSVPPARHTLTVRAYGDAIVRLTIAFHGKPIPDQDNPMLAPHPAGASAQPLSAAPAEHGWDILDAKGRVRMRVDTREKPIRFWREKIPPPPAYFAAEVLPDGHTAVPFMAFDTFCPDRLESVSLGYAARGGAPVKSLFSFHARHDEAFAGTGERFAKMDLSGRTLVLQNQDALGVNNRRAYKNVPFYVSSRPYGLFMCTPAHARLSLADISTRAAQGLVEEPWLDLFVIGGGSLERILYGYRCITGFPPELPLWSYGVWMSRMTYATAGEAREAAGKMRDGRFPFDVIHIDGHWFRGQCDWEFDPARFPDPEGFMREMRAKGIRTSVWQAPWIDQATKLFEPAREQGLMAYSEQKFSTGSEFGSQGNYRGFIDFMNPRAVQWYKALLEPLLRMGVSVVKTDFGEEIETDSPYGGVPYERVHNLYGLLYPKAAFEKTAEMTGEGITWSRPAWAGSQRYPVHWNGDSASTWDGLAATIRGGIHIGLSGFAFWSHDVPGFHGLPDFMSSWPEDDLYVRWTQVGVFTSHMRYHGTSPREPYEYPAVADIVRKWLHLRYALIPYIVAQAAETARSGFPLFRALALHHEDDPVCWHIDDQYYFGETFLVAPILNSRGVRDVYLPRGTWIDLWSGECTAGPVWIRALACPLERMPVYARSGATISVYPRAIQCTDEMDMQACVPLRFDHAYRGIASTVLGDVMGL
ncbi:MAG: alpha-xylosidase [Chitinivibrionales bacterium]|nr:alpha-xylosidase [Chitinivibrionales bacterium]MBD3395789.1 alpha-xylosidase [Chitinivibrionales bacterium]